VTEPSTTRRPDLFTLIAGIASLFVSGYVLSDGALWAPWVDPRWLLAGGAVVIGLLLLAVSLRRGKSD